MENLFNPLFDYNYQANKTLITQALENSNYPAKCVEWLSHILNAHHIWNKRIVEEEASYTVWQLHNKTDWEDLHYENQRETFEILRNVDDFTKRVSYTSSEGKSYSNEVKDILFHIVNHSTHHRGQIATELRKNNIAPKELDYIYFKR